jgi:hypothetical protein
MSSSSRGLAATAVYSASAASCSLLLFFAYEKYHSKFTWWNVGRDEDTSTTSSTGKEAQCELEDLKEDIGYASTNDKQKEEWNNVEKETKEDGKGPLEPSSTCHVPQLQSMEGISEEVKNETNPPLWNSIENDTNKMEEMKERNDGQIMQEEEKGNNDTTVKSTKLMNETLVTGQEEKEENADEKDGIMSVWTNKTKEAPKEAPNDAIDTKQDIITDCIAPPTKHSVTFETNRGRPFSPPKAVVTFDERPSSAITIVDETEPVEPIVEYESDSDVSYDDDISRRSIRSLVRLDSDLSLMQSKTFTKDDIGSVGGGHMDPLLEQDSMMSNSSMDVSTK